MAFYYTHCEFRRLVPIGGVVSKQWRLNKRRNEKMTVVSMSYLLEAGVHFGHQT